MAALVRSSLLFRASSAQSVRAVSVTLLEVVSSRGKHQTRDQSSLHTRQAAHLQLHVAPWSATGRGATMLGRAYGTAAAEAAGTVAAAALTFTPGHAALGGLLLGVATTANLLLNGRVLGISGAIKGLVHGDRAPWRTALLGGMMLTALPLAALLPGAFDALPATYTVARAALGGLLVGLGAALGNGCTSGHGICGNARLSPRSMAYTATFMAAGMAVATLTGTLISLGVPLVHPVYEALPAAQLSAGLGLAAAATMAAAGLALASKHSRDVRLRHTLDVGASAALGSVFAVGLALSGMTRPAKVAAFLSPFSGAWDLSLMFVMAAAIGVAILPYQAVIASLFPSPVWAKNPALQPAFCLPPQKAAVDARLLVGGVLFGAGWGLSGMCPGPALVAVVGHAGPQVAAYLVALLAGVALEPAIAKVLPAALQLRPSPAATPITLPSTPSAVSPSPSQDDLSVELRQRTHGSGVKGGKRGDSSQQ